MKKRMLLTTLAVVMTVVMAGAGSTAQARGQINNWSAFGPYGKIAFLNHTGATYGQYHTYHHVGHRGVLR